MTRKKKVLKLKPISDTPVFETHIDELSRQSKRPGRSGLNLDPKVARPYVETVPEGSVINVEKAKPAKDIYCQTWGIELKIRVTAPKELIQGVISANHELLCQAMSKIEGRSSPPDVETTTTLDVYVMMY